MSRTDELESDLELESNMNCQEIKSATDIASTNNSFQAHLVECSACRQHVTEMNSLRALLRQQPRLEVPGDYDFRLRARIARAESERQMATTSLLSAPGRGLWHTLTEWAGNGPLRFSLDLRGGVAAAAVAALVVGLSFYRPSEESNHSLPASNIASSSQFDTGNLATPNPLASENVEAEATLAAAAPAQTVRNSRSRRALIESSTEVSSTPLAEETIALQGVATRSNLSGDNAWRVYNAERREMISSAQQTTYLGAESAPRLTRAGTKEIGFVPSI